MSEQKIREIAEAFMKETPEEYEGETTEEVMDQLRQTSPSFIDFTHKTYYPEKYQ